MINAIPTAYRGVNFRSRLEAKWAAFFDLLGWRWEYEPFDRDGWIPDFALIGKEQTPLVEVKPVTGMGDQLFKATAAKIQSCLNFSRAEEALIVTYFLPLDRCEEPAIGWISGETQTSEWAPAPFMQQNGEVGFYHPTGSWIDRISGKFNESDSDCYVSDETVIQRTWIEAGNIVQWRAKGRR